MKIWRVVSIASVLAFILSTGCALQTSQTPTQELIQLMEDGDDQAVLKFLGPSARRGDPYAQMRTGRLYMRETEVARNLDLAKDWIGRAADGGLSWARVLLELVEKHGWPASKTQEFKMWLKEAETGNAVAQSVVGEYYMFGFGTQTDFARAEEWSRRAANAGESLGMENLGIMYNTGEGLVPDKVRSAA
jgi:TPR repeat protein